MNDMLPWPSVPSIAPQASAAADDRSGAPLLQFGKYQLLRLLARGGMGEVYLARLVGELGFEKQLVIKTILPELAADPRFIEMFASEAKTAVALSHGNIVPTYELGRADETFYIVMGHVDGPSVAQLLTAERKRDLAPSREIALHIVRKVLSGLAYAHRGEGGRPAVVHRDITPNNILIDRSGQVRIVDFGIASPARHTTQMRGGSRGYMAPEQARGEPALPSADVFSVGCLLYELCTYKRAFPKPDVWSRPALDSLPAQLQGPLERAFSLDPTQRPQDAGAFLHSLRPALAAHSGVFDDFELARHLRELFGEDWEPDAQVANASHTALRDFEGENKTFATRLTAITTLEPEPLASRSNPLLADVPVRAGADSVDDASLATADGAHSTSGSGPLAAASSETFAASPRRSLAFVLGATTLLVVGASVVGAIAFALGRDGAVPVAPAQTSDWGPTSTAVAAVPNNTAQSAPPVDLPPVDSTQPPLEPVVTTIEYPFTVSPAHAQARLDGVRIPGRSPFVVRLSSRRASELTLSASGHATKRLQLAPEGDLAHSYQLAASVPREPGFMKVLAPTVPWAEVWVDGRNLGSTPTRKLSLPSGRHRVQVVCVPDACASKRVLLNRWVTIDPNRTARIEARE